MSTIVSVATASWPAELDAGHATESVLLASSSSSSSGRRELSIYRESDNGLLLRLVERIWSDTQPPTCQIIERFLDLQEDTVLPIYAVSAPPRAEWDMEVLYAKGKSPIVYQLRDRQQVFRMQRVLTGYRAAKHFENIRCTVIYKNRRLPVVGRALSMQGKGEVQLWRWPKAQPSNFPLPLSPASSHTGSLPPQRELTRSMVPDTVRRHSGVSVQSDLRGQERVVLISSPPPVLVVFMQENKQYTMLKTDGKLSLVRI
jgi:hypothetical protein